MEKPSFFPQTRWSLVRQVQQANPAEREHALEELCRIYWKPLYRFARSRGHSKEDAEDQVQGFLANLLKYNSWATVDESKGRLRAFLYRSFENHLRNCWRKGQAIKNGGGVKLLSLDFDDAESLLPIAHPAEDSANLSFDRHWAAALVQQAVNRIEEEFDEKKTRLLAALRPHFVPGIGGGKPYAEIAVELNQSEASIKMAVKRLREKLRNRLEGAVMETVDSQEAAEEELRYLFDLLNLE
tara:strand:- start:7883 stop:8605 length:723 start_codon:yes stop_codon:yes gene_type:complete